MSWDRVLWGVRFVDTSQLIARPGRREGMLLGQGWDNVRPGTYEGEPTRALLFTTRKLARAWCQRKQTFYRTYPDGHVCRSWRFQPVRARERVTTTARLAERR
jgi:hypothetical protein